MPRKFKLKYEGVVTIHGEFVIDAEDEREALELGQEHLDTLTMEDFEGPNLEGNDKGICSVTTDITTIEAEGPAEDLGEVDDE